MPPLLRRTLPLLAAMVGLALLFRCFVPMFLTPDNLLDLAQQIAVNAILAFGMTLVILIGGIDLSVGAVVALVGTVTTYAVLPTGWHLPISLAMLAGLGSALCFGLFHGTVAARTPIPPFIITLGTMLIARGFALRFNDGKPMRIPLDQHFFLSLGNEYLLKIPVPVWLMLGAYAITAVILHFTVFGRHLYAIGNSRWAALYSGIRVRGCEIIVYAMASALTCLAGFIHCSQLTSAAPASGLGFELNAIAAAVVGGASFQGGRGSMTGTLIGAIIIGILDKGLNQAGVHYSYQSILKGAVILVAVWLDVRKQSKT